MKVWLEEDEESAEAVFTVLTKGPEWVIAEWDRLLGQWEQVAAQEQRNEQELHEALAEGPAEYPWGEKAREAVPSGACR